MKIYKVKVNGKLYEVELEAVEEKAGHIEAAPEKKVEAAAPVSGGSNVLAPIGGKVVDIKVSEGTAVKKGQCVLIIEAMKLENEVVAPCDGVVKAIKTSKGTVVQAKDVLVILG